MTSVKNLFFYGRNIREIPSDQLAKLTSIVTDRVAITGNPVSQLGAILASVQSEELSLEHMSLSEENIQALVTAMRERVQHVYLYFATLDPEFLAAYDGQGHCTWLGLGGYATRYETRLKTWAGDRGWAVTKDESWILVMERQ